MITELNKTQHNNELSDRQLKAIPFIVSSTTYTEGCEKAAVKACGYYLRYNVNGVLSIQVQSKARSVILQEKMVLCR